MKIGLGRNDITPRVGVELCGFGPFILRRSIAVRDRLWARAAAIEHEGRRTVLISCDLVGIGYITTQKVRRYVAAATGVEAGSIMLTCTHTHSGPSTGIVTGWGELDQPYLETLPQRISLAAIQAVAQLQPATLSHAAVPCEGIALNREYDLDAPPLEEVLRDDWRPAKPELTDTTCHVLRIESAGKITGFLSYFSCHPVVCCQTTRYLHGDFVGVATNLIEREHPGSIGLFLQGALGDVNSCVVHKPEDQSILALDVIASRYAQVIRRGLTEAQPLKVDDVVCASDHVHFTRKPWGRDKIRAMLAEKEAIVGRIDATDQSGVNMEVVYLLTLRRFAAALEAGQSLSPPVELQGLRLGPIALLGTPLEAFQAIKNDVVAKARSPFPLVMSLVNDAIGYAVDHTTAASGGYAADMVPLMCGTLPFANIHDELVQALLTLEAKLF